MDRFARGQLVKLVPQWLSSPEEADARYRVVEDNGDRLIVEYVCDLPIPPQELVRREMAVAVQE